MNDVNDIVPIKIVIMGMDNAGKSTLVDLLTGECCEHPKSPNREPTKGVTTNHLTLFDRNTVVWDFGGQEIYRNKYLQNPTAYFDSIAFFYYVVDAQDNIKQYSSAMYFKGVFQLIRKYSPKAKLIFLFHKMDPDFDPKEKEVKKQFLDDILPFLRPTNIKYSTYDTTIHDLSTIKTAFKDEICADE